MRPIYFILGLLVMAVGFMLLIVGLPLTGLSNEANIIQFTQGFSESVAIGFAVMHIDRIIRFVRALRHVKHLPELIRKVDEIHEKHVENADE